MDAVAAFLNGEIKDDVFVEQLIGYRVRGKVCKLMKTLYGLRTSPAIWYRIQAAFLKSIGYEQLTQDPALFSKRGPRGVVFILSYVDDYLITGSDKQGIQEIKDAMAKRFKMKDMGACVGYLGMKIKRNEEARTIHLA
jgi:Reverse transcriptase (RNA-dependent DNA polymerase)